MSQTTSQAARGKWPMILQHFGIDARYLNRKHHECPTTGDGCDRFRFSDHEGNGRYFCACSDGSEGGINLVMCKTGMDFKEAAAAIDKLTGRDPKFDEVKQVYYSETLRKAARQSQRSRYLESRKLEVAPALRFHESVDYRNGEEDGAQPLKLNAMLAPITLNGQFMTYHVTYLQDGKKANVPTVRKILPGPSWIGGACELYPVDGPILGIAEGVETAIAAKLMNLHPVWAALNTSGLAKWRPPEGIEEIIIYADHDSNFAGHAAAYALAHRLTGGQHGKLRVSVLIPPKVDTDWADVWLEMCLKQG